MGGWLAVAAAGSILAACSLAKFDEFSGGEIPPDACDVSTIVDAPANDDTGTPIADASIDGDAGPSSHGCADYPGAFFCADFDDNRLPGPFALASADSPATIALADDLTFSATKSLRIQVPTAAAGTAASASRNYSNTATKSARFQLAFRYEERGSADLELLAFRFGEYYVQVQLRSDDFPYIIERRPPTVDGGGTATTDGKGTLPLDPKRWYAVRLDVDFATKQVNLFFDGALAGTRTLPSSFKFDSNELRIIAGDLFINDNVGTWDVRIDDVVVFVE